MVRVSNLRITYGMHPKNLPLPFNGTERNESFHYRLIIFRYPFTICSWSVRGLCVFSVSFGSIFIYFLVAQSGLAHGNLMYIHFCYCSF